MAGCTHTAATQLPTKIAAPWPGIGATRHQTPARVDCKQAPAPYTNALVFPSRYEGSGTSRDIVNKKADARYAERTRNIRDFEKLVVHGSDEFLASGANADCVLRWLERWARAQAITAPSGKGSGRAVRKWALASLAAAYIKVQPAANAEQQAFIEPWLTRLAGQVRSEWRQPDVEKRNNHHYWAAWAVGLVAVATQDRSMLEWSDAVFTGAMHQIEDGYLPNEMRRGRRALLYHNYAVQPLVMLAELLTRNGRDAWARPELHQLIYRVAQGVTDMALFEDLTTQPQEIPGVLTGWSLAWYFPARQRLRIIEAHSRIRTPDIDKHLPPNTRYYSTRLGGRMSLLFPE